MKTPISDFERAKWVTFERLPMGTTFECNGNIWTKTSTRTATGVWPAYLPRRSYFRAYEIVRASI